MFYSILSQTILTFLIPVHVHLMSIVWKKIARYLGYICCITGNRIWRYTGFELDADYPKTFDNSGFPARAYAAIAMKNEHSKKQQVYLFGVCKSS